MNGVYMGFFKSIFEGDSWVSWVVVDIPGIVWDCDAITRLEKVVMAIIIVFIRDFMVGLITSLF